MSQRALGCPNSLVQNYLSTLVLSLQMSIYSLWGTTWDNIFKRDRKCVYPLSLYYDDDGIGATLLHICERGSGGLFHCAVTTNFIFILIPYYPYHHGRLARWRKWRTCDVGEAIEGLENELWRRWSNGRVGGEVTEGLEVKWRKGWRMSCDVGEVTERLENELCSLNKANTVDCGYRHMKQVL